MDMSEKVLTFSAQVEIPTSRELRVTLPQEIPVGPAQLSITTGIDQPVQGKTFGAFLRSEYVGLWRDREEITDSVKFARQLRKRAWRRTR
jgi:hypothetical protein